MNDKVKDTQNKLIALKKGDLICRRSYFSTWNDIVITMNKGSSVQFDFFNTRLIYDTVTSGYWHKEALYIDYHQAAENDVIKLPDYLDNISISI